KVAQGDVRLVRADDLHGGREPCVIRLRIDSVAGFAADASIGIPLHGDAAVVDGQGGNLRRPPFAVLGHVPTARCGFAGEEAVVADDHAVESAQTQVAHVAGPEPEYAVD